MTSKDLVSLLPLVVIVLVVSCIVIVDINKQKDTYSYQETNHVGLVYLGLEPSTHSREITERDIDTGIKLKDGDKLYSLIESRSLEKGDFGKTFIIRIK